MALRLECHLVRHANHRPLVSQSKVVSVFAKIIVAKRRIPTEQEILRLVHRDVHGVRNFHARRKIVIARHRDAARYLQPQSFLPERNLMHHVLENVSARIIPEKSPIDEALRVKFMRSGLSFELLPAHVVEIAVRGNLPFPSSVRSVPVVVRVNSREGSQAIGRREFARPRERFSARGLHTHLHHAVRAFKGAAHAPCVVRIKRHGFFLIDILAGLKSGNEIQSVLMLGSGDQHRVNGLVLEQTAKIAKCLNCGREFLGFLLPARVNVSDRDGLSIG